MKYYLYRSGDGNEGNFPRTMVALNDDDCPYAALRALVINDFQSGHSRRRFIARNLEIDGESHYPNYGPNACVYQGPRGIMAYDAAWLTAELEPCPFAAEEWASGRASYYNAKPMPIRDVLDKGARAILEAGKVGANAA